MPENQTITKLEKKLSVLITGGSGLIGKNLSSVLITHGHKVSLLSRNVSQQGNVIVFRWNPEKKIIPPQVFEGVDYLIHLAGANIGEMRWTKKRKEEIVKSRVDSAKFLHNIITDNGIRLKGFITASAVGYYGSVTCGKIFNEDDSPGKDFLGDTCRLWEEAADQFSKDGIRTVKIRNAVVLQKNDYALSKLMLPAKYGFVIRIGNGNQYMPWIHINDLCNIYLKAVEDENMTGVYNAVSSDHVTHNEFIRTLARVMSRPVFLPPVPAFLFRMAFGEMSVVMLKGSRISSEKIKNAGYRFLFNNLEDALNNVISE